jgi:hypothetical protein
MTNGLRAKAATPPAFRKGTGGLRAIENWLEKVRLIVNWSRAVKCVSAKNEIALWWIKWWIEFCKDPAL